MLKFKTLAAILGAALVACTPASEMASLQPDPVIEVIPTPKLLPPPTLTPADNFDALQISTAIGDLEFKKLRFPANHEFTQVVNTPFGLAAIDNFPSLCWSSTGERWDCVLLSSCPIQLTSISNELVVHERNGASIYFFDNNRWTKIDSIELDGSGEQFESQPREVIAVNGSTILYSSGGIHFAEALLLPDKKLPGIDKPQGELDINLGSKCRGTYRSSNPNKKFGPILSSAAEFLMLTPSNPVDWENTPLCEPLIWKSAEGYLWELAADKSPFGESAFVRNIAGWKGRFVATGVFDWHVGAVWSTEDGLTWERADLALSYAGTVSAGESGWMLLGKIGNQELDAPSQNVWFSIDGKVWDGPYPCPHGLQTGFFSPQVAIGSGVVFGVGSDDRIPVIGRLQP